LEDLTRNSDDSGDKDLDPKSKNRNSAKPDNDSDGAKANDSDGVRSQRSHKSVRSVRSMRSNKSAKSQRSIRSMRSNRSHKSVRSNSPGGRGEKALEKQNARLKAMGGLKPVVLAKKDWSRDEMKKLLKCQKDYLDEIYPLSIDHYRVDMLAKEEERRAARRAKRAERNGKPHR